MNYATVYFMSCLTVFDYTCWHAFQCESPIVVLLVPSGTYD